MAKIVNLTDCVSMSCASYGGWEEIEQARKIVSTGWYNTVMDQRRFETFFSGLLGMKAEEFVQAFGRQRHTC